MNNIFVYIEIEEGKIADVSLELLTKGRDRYGGGILLRPGGHSRHAV